MYPRGDEFPPQRTEILLSRDKVFSEQILACAASQLRQMGHRVQKSVCRMAFRGQHFLNPAVQIASPRDVICVFSSLRIFLFYLKQ